MCIMLLYHGTIDKYAHDIIANGIDLRKSKSFLDFGPGFYTTTSRAFAENTAKLRMKRYNAFHKEAQVGWKVIELVCDETELQTLNVKKFQLHDAEWGRFIIANRCNNPSVHTAYDNNTKCQYDIVSGPTADGKGTLTPIVAAVNKGGLRLEDVDCTKFAPSEHGIWGEQTSFHTEKSLACIKKITML